jgi:PAS domain S-box-containing protein
MKNTILIIEDDNMLRESTADYLIEEGYEIHEADNGLDGIQKALELIPDLILCDIAMPKLDGYQVYKTLQENSTTTHIPFIYLTAKTEMDDIRAGMQLGADDYITKPFDYDELQAAIITRLEKYKKLLHNFQDNFNALMDNSLVGVFITEELKIIFHNKKFAKILDYDENVLKNKDLTELIYEEDQADFQKAIKKCEKGIIKKINHSFKILKGNNQYIQVEYSGGLTNLNGNKAILGTLIQKQNGSATTYYSPESLDNLNQSIDIILRKKDFITSEMARKLVETLNPPTQNNEAKNVDNLTKREIEVLQHICKGFTNQQIADNLFVSVRTVDTHRAHLLEKTNSRNTAQLIIYAVKNGFIDLKTDN